MKKIDISSFLDIKSVSSVAFSPDGKFAAFVVTGVNGEENRYEGDIWLYEVASGSVRQLTYRKNARSFLWLQNGHLLFPNGAQDGTHYYEIDPNGAEAHESFCVPMGVRSIEELEPGVFLVCGLKKHPAKKLSSGNYEAIEETPFWFNGAGFLQGQRKQLFLFRVSDSSCTPLSEALSDVRYFDRRGRKLIYQAYPWKDCKKDLFRCGLYLYDLDTNEQRTLLQPGTMVNYRIAFWQDDRLLFSGTDEIPDGEGQCSDFYVLDIKTGQYEKFRSNDTCVGVDSIVADIRYGGGFSAKRVNDSYYYIATEHGVTHLNRLTPDGALVRILDGTHAGTISCFDVYKDLTLAVQTPAGGLGELYCNGKRVTHVNDDYISAHTISMPEYQTITDADGFTVEGWVMKPAGYRPGLSYPAIVHIHGGPVAAFGAVYHHEMQVWANAGYFVFFCNPRGSDGCGAAFMDINGKWGTVDYENILQFTDEMCRRYPDVDAKRVAVCGGSYGGFMTNWVIGHTNRFAAAVSQRSMANLVGYEYISDIGAICMESEHRATVRTDAQTLWQHSPLRYAPNCKTPTLFIQSDQDYRCYMTDTISMFNALKFSGCPARLCLFHGENHELSRSGKPEHRIARMQEILSWLDSWLKYPAGGEKLERHPV